VSPELRFSLSLAGDQVVLAITGTNVPAGLFQVQRPVPGMAGEALDALQEGDIDKTTYNNLVNVLSGWFFDNEVREILKNSLPGNGSGLRLVFVIKDNVRTLMSELPFELLWHETPDSPLIVRKDVKCLVYRLEKSAAAASNPALKNWPLKVLLVRSSPPDQNAVPTVAGLRTHILELGERFGKDMVQVDVISGEPGIDRPATWSKLQAHLQQSNQYSLMVYFGHGRLAHTAGERVAQILLEAEDGGGNQPISSGQLAKLLTDVPIPVVLLTGCVTAADPAGVERRSGAAQGVAQALVNSSVAGVQVAVGMRTEVRTDAAEEMLKAFFSALLDRTKGGDIDAAVWSARSKLFLTKPFPPSWAAPVVFRAIETEPLLDFVAQPVSFEVSRDMDKFLQFRARFWKFLPDLTGEALDEVEVAIVGLEESLREAGLKIGPLMMPERANAVPGKQATFSVFLHGTLSIRSLTGSIVVPESAARITAVKLTPAAKNAGFKMAEPTHTSTFSIESIDGTQKLLDDKELLTVTMDVPTTAPPGIHSLKLEVSEIVPRAKYWPGDNVLVVRPA
jgi:hypothetical protein